MKITLIVTIIYCVLIQFIDCAIRESHGLKLNDVNDESDRKSYVGERTNDGEQHYQNYFQKYHPEMMNSHGYMDKDGWLSQMIVKKEIPSWTPTEHIQKVIYIRQPIEIIKKPVIVEEKSFTVKSQKPLVIKSKVFGGHIGRIGHGHEIISEEPAVIVGGTKEEPKVEVPIEEPKIEIPREEPRPEEERVSRRREEDLRGE